MAAKAPDITASRTVLLCVIFAASAAASGCGVGGAGSSPPPPAITVSVSPPTASVLLGATQQFAATVSNTANTSVNWSVNGVAGGNSVLGTISSLGLYTAPQNLLSPAGVTIAATSVADPSKSASAAVTLTSDLAVSVTPVAADAELGTPRQFTVSVASAGNPNRAVDWSVAGTGCFGAACGTVDSSGLYTAPQIRPSPASMTLTARSVADPSKAASATINVTSNFTLTVSGPSAVNAGATAQFTATLTPAPNSNPSTVINWSVTGGGCSGSACGTITSTGRYTAPAFAPSPNMISITAIPAADPLKAASIPIAIVALVSINVSPSSASVELARAQPFTATVTGVPDPSVTWDVNGIVGGNTMVGTVINSPSDPNRTTYTAPVNMPTPSQVTVEARNNALPSLYSTATVTLFSNVAVQLSPVASTRAVSHRQTFTAQVANSPNQTVEWRVNGIPGGNATLGLICVADANPCQQITTTNGGNVDYLAPASVPSSNPVTVSATSQADPTKSGTAQVTILAHVLVSVLPSSATLAPGASQQFSAIVEGTSNQNVTWQVLGGGCGGSGSPCGTIDSLGLYTAPLVAPVPNAVTISATSADDTSRAGTATVTLATGPIITTLLPASSTAGAVGSFTLKVLGGNFVSGGSGSTILFNNTARTTTCASTRECTTTLAAADLATAGNFPVLVRNPNASFSNQVSYVVVPFTASEDVIALSPAAPRATGKDIVVVEPSTAGTASELNLNIAAMGPFFPATSNCVLGGSPVALVRPTSGTVNAEICAFSFSGLDPALNYTISGPAPNDINIVAKQPLGLGFIHLTLQLSSTTLTGARVLFVENPNKDKAGATGALEAK